MRGSPAMGGSPAAGSLPGGVSGHSGGNSSESGQVGPRTGARGPAPPERARSSLPPTCPEQMSSVSARVSPVSPPSTSIQLGALGGEGKSSGQG